MMGSISVIAHAGSDDEGAEASDQEFDDNAENDPARPNQRCA